MSIDAYRKPLETLWNERTRSPPLREMNDGRVSQWSHSEDVSGFASRLPSWFREERTQRRELQRLSRVSV